MNDPRELPLSRQQVDRRVHQQLEREALKIDLEP
jgi:hypothetical protein